jgi:hypothetical protein
MADPSTKRSGGQVLVDPLAPLAHGPDLVLGEPQVRMNADPLRPLARYPR